MRARAAPPPFTTTVGFKEAYQQYCEGGWQGLQHPADFGGQGLPKTIGAACGEMLNSANMSFALCPLLTDGAIEALLTAGSDDMKAKYLEKLISGQWTGTMNLTEPQAGSDLAAVRTRAEPQPDGSYKLFGTKIFITYGEHDMADNIIHLVLARVQGAPEGVKGISLFVVPKVLVKDDGSLGDRNDVYCVSIEHKMGIKASPTAVLQYGDHGGAVGYLVGEENRGLEYMFIMMNAARYAVGVQGISIAERAYQKAVQYARDRVQSRPVDGSLPKAGPILHHPDVRRMLMTMRALTEGCRAMAVVAAAAHDAAAAQHYPHGALYVVATPIGNLADLSLRGRAEGMATLEIDGKSRVARGATGRDMVIKFEGCYHGHADSMLVKAGSGLLTFGNPTSSGVPEDFAKHTMVLDYNDSAQLEDAFAKMGDRIAAVIVEPVAGNMNLLPATPAFLKTMRALCDKHGALLMFDEVMSGFRVALGGAQALYGIKPDLTALGKVIGGGLPVAAFGGRADIMHCLAPVGPVYQAGTLSGNPVAVAAGLKTLSLIQASNFHEKLAATAKRLVDGLSAAAKEAGIDFSANSIGGMFGIYFSKNVPTSFDEVMKSDKEAFNRFFHLMLDEGVYLAPSAFEAGFVSAAHSQEDIDATIAAAKRSFAKLKN